MFECYFRIEPEKARQIDGDEQEIADFFFSTRSVRLGEGYPQLGSFFKELSEDALYRFPVEAYLSGSAGQLMGFDECGEAARDTLKGGREELLCRGGVIFFFGL